MKQERNGAGDQLATSAIVGHGKEAAKIQTDVQAGEVVIVHVQRRMAGDTMV